MSTKQRQPRELLERIKLHSMAEFNSDGLHDWHWAALGVCKDADEHLQALPPEPVPRPKRPIYYGAKGSLTNPFR